MKTILLFTYSSSYGAEHLDGELLQQQSYTSTHQPPIYTTTHIPAAARELPNSEFCFKEGGLADKLTKVAFLTDNVCGVCLIYLLFFVSVSVFFFCRFYH